jgi:hypothetical protein
MPPIALTDAQLHELQQAAQLVPYNLRSLYLERVALVLRGQEIGDGVVHRIVYQVAREITWDAGRTVAVG